MSTSPFAASQAGDATSRRQERCPLSVCASLPFPLLLLQLDFLADKQLACLLMQRAQ
jgi:hypothetical protein